MKGSLTTHAIHFTLIIADCLYTMSGLFVPPAGLQKKQTVWQ
jgi:hypothetical protein